MQSTAEDSRFPIPCNSLQISHLPLIISLCFCLMMIKEKESSSESESKIGEKIISEGNEDLQKSPDENNGFQEKGIDFLKEKSSSNEKTNMMIAFDGSVSYSSQLRNIVSNYSSQELTLSYLCDNSNKDAVGKNLLNGFEKVNGGGGSYKGKEIMVSEDQNDRWVERDFLQLNDSRGNSSKREAEDVENEVKNREKKPKIETLNLSLALPDISLSLAGSNRVQNGEFPARLRSCRSIQSVAPSNNNTQTTYSNDFTAASLSYSCSHPFSHNPSCSLTRNSAENYEYSVGSHRRDCDQIWNCGEGTNGSVHSRFRPTGDGGVALANHAGGSFTLGNCAVNRDSCNNSIYQTASSDNNSFFPSELPARPRLDTQSGDSRGKGSENLRGLESLDGERARKLSRPERILREIVSESIPIMALIFQELPQETVESTKEYLKNLIEMPDQRDELASLQRKLQRRSDLSMEALSKSHKSQLEILVAMKMGLGSYLSSKNRVTTTELVEIFLLERCRNIACKRALPVDDCDCKICSTKKGFCSECMCPVCDDFDCANNTCIWVGCDVCSHWCHAACGIQRNLIKPGPGLKCPSGTTEMLFHCLGCGHSSEMFGFVKDVFMSCAKEWSLETLIKELDCVKKIFRGSEDFKGKELYAKADEMVIKLKKKILSPSDVCSFIFQFFNCANGLKDTTSHPGLRNDVACVAPNSSFYNMSASSGRPDMTPVDLHQNDLKASHMSDKIIEDEWSVTLSKKDGFDSLERVVRIKEAEARMFQSRADEARTEAENFRRMVRIKIEKLEEEYAEKLAKLCLPETEERQRKKLEELKILEDSHCNYYKMKMRMQAEIAGLLKRMEATKQLWI